MEPRLAPLTPRSRGKFEAPPTLPNMYLPKSASSSVEDDMNQDSPLTPMREMNKKKKQKLKGMDEATRKELIAKLRNKQLPPDEKQ
jgi:hypothetical protein